MDDSDIKEIIEYVNKKYSENVPRPVRFVVRKKAKMMEKFDTNGDGELSEEERAAAKAEMEARRDERRAEMEKKRAEFLGKYDTDGDGELSEEERKAAREARKAEMLAKYDKNGDGELSEGERNQMRKDFEGKRPGGKHRKGGHGKGHDRGGDRGPADGV